MNWVRAKDVDSDLSPLPNLLTATGSLTAQIIKLYNSDNVRIELLNNHYIRNQSFWWREVIIHCDGDKVLYAISIFPQQVLQRYYDKIISNTPLGYWLFLEQNLTRTRQLYTTVKFGGKSGDLFFKNIYAYLGLDLQEKLIARKSILKWDHGKVMLYEALLPDIYKKL